MKSPEQYAREAWGKLSSGKIVNLNTEEVVRELTPFFKAAMGLSTYHAARVERARLPEDLRKVLQLAYDVIFDIVLNKPSAKDCVEKCLRVSPALHEALYPSMHG